MNFLELGLSEQTVRAIEEFGIQEPTTVQSDVIPSILEGKDVFTIAPQGCGKTMSYVFPLVDIISTKGAQNILIITPNSEQSVITSDRLAIFNKYHSINEATIKDGEEDIDNEANVIIGSPDLLVEIVENGKIDLSKFEKKRKEIVEGKENIYIIDTNVFVNCPNIIDRIGHKYKVIIPAKVLEELDKLKLKNNIDKNALNTAARNINLAFSKQFSKMEDADINLLPIGFDKNNPDCQILSVALKYKGENPIILTSDNILQTRAKGLGITTISLTDFLRQLR